MVEAVASKAFRVENWKLVVDDEIVANLAVLLLKSKAHSLLETSLWLPKSQSLWHTALQKLSSFLPTILFPLKWRGNKSQRILTTTVIKNVQNNHAELLLLRALGVEFDAPFLNEEKAEFVRVTLLEYKRLCKWCPLARRSFAGCWDRGLARTLERSSSSESWALSGFSHFCQSESHFSATSKSKRTEGCASWFFFPLRAWPQCIWALWLAVSYWSFDLACSIWFPAAWQPGSMSFWTSFRWSSRPCWASRRRRRRRESRIALTIRMVLTSLSKEVIGVMSP